MHTFSQLTPQVFKQSLGGLALHAAPIAAGVGSTDEGRLLGAVLDANLTFARQTVVAVVVGLAIVALFARVARRASAVAIGFVVVLDAVVAVRGKAILIERVPIRCAGAKTRAAIGIFVAALIICAGVAVAAAAINVCFRRFLHAVFAARLHANATISAAASVNSPQS